MDTNKVLNGSHGFTATGFAKSAILNQLGFIMANAATTVTDRTKDVPVMDAGILARVQAATGDNGLAQPQKLDVNELLDAHAAAYHLVARHVNTPNPENGRKDEHLRKWLVDPKTLITKSANYKNDLRVKTAKDQAMAQATMLYGEFDKQSDGTMGPLKNPDVVAQKAAPRIAAIEKEAAAQVAIDLGPFEQVWVNAIEKYSAADTQELIDACCEALTNAGRNPANEIKAAAKAVLENGKKRLSEGEFVKIDAGIFALAQ